MRILRCAVAAMILVGCLSVGQMRLGHPIVSAANALGLAGSGKRIALKTRTPGLRIAPDAEEEMLRLVNRERAKRGLRPLVMDSRLRQVARAHSADMIRRGYFSHNSPEGVDPFRRMRRGGVRFQAAGENLAAAQSVQIAHKCLMKSRGHRDNILYSRFRRVGIGAVVGGRRGMMFTQDFAD